MANELIMSSLSMEDYLGPRDLSEHLKLTHELTFHWANWDQTCLLQKKNFKKFNNNMHLMRLNQSLEQLRSKPVWLCNKIKIVKSDLYSLYESYLDSRLRLTWFERKDEILFSFAGEQGPYYTTTSMKWLEAEIYTQFVMRKILLENHNLRSFRLNANIPLLLKLNNDVKEYGDKITIHQISEVGIIFKISDKNFLNKFKNSKILELKMPIRKYQKIVNLDLIKSLEILNNLQISSDKDEVTFTLESRVLNFYGNMNNAQRTTEENFFIFARFEDLVSQSEEVELKNIFPDLIKKTKKHFSNSMQGFEVKNIWKKSA